MYLVYHIHPSSVLSALRSFQDVIVRPRKLTSPAYIIAQLEEGNFEINVVSGGHEWGEKERDNWEKRLLSFDFLISGHLGWPGAIDGLGVLL